MASPKVGERVRSKPGAFGPSGVVYEGVVTYVHGDERVHVATKVQSGPGEVIGRPTDFEVMPVG